MCSDPFGLVGSTIAGHFAVEAVVGEGGSSVVYRARHTLWDRLVAIKALRALDAADAEVRDRLLRCFFQEGAMLAELSEQTTAIVQARDTATLVTASGEWVPYMVLEWLEGESLESALWQERRVELPPRDLRAAVTLVEPVAQALGLAHAKGICHRDLKPANVFVLGDPRSNDCTLKLLDFGVATFFGDRRRTGARRPAVAARAFTPSYAAPEQLSEACGATGPWTDVFALALILLELLTGRSPGVEQAERPQGESPDDPARHSVVRASGVELPARVEEVLDRALAVYPSERWPTAGRFWHALREAMDGAARAAPNAPPSSPSLLTLRPLSSPAPGLACASGAPEDLVAAPSRRIAPAAGLMLAMALAASALVSDARFGPVSRPGPSALASARAR